VAAVIHPDFDVGEELRDKPDFIDDRPFSQGVGQQQRVTMSPVEIERVVQDDIGVVGEAIRFARLAGAGNRFTGGDDYCSRSTMQI